MGEVVIEDRIVGSNVLNPVDEERHEKKTMTLKDLALRIINQQGLSGQFLGIIPSELHGRLIHSSKCYDLDDELEAWRYSIKTAQNLVLELMSDEQNTQAVIEAQNKILNFLNVLISQAYYFKDESQN